MSTASIPAISSSWSLKNARETREHIRSGIRVTMLLLIPAAVGMSVLAYPIIGILFPQEETVATSTLMLALGSPGIVFFGLSTLTNGILQALGEVNTPLKNAATALIYHLVITILLIDVYTFRTLCFDDSQLFIWFTSMLFKSKNVTQNHTL